MSYVIYYSDDLFPVATVDTTENSVKLLVEGLNSVNPERVEYVDRQIYEAWRRMTKEERLN